MSDCRRIGERLPAYVDGHLPPDDSAAIARHLDRCPACRTMADQEQTGHLLLRRRAAQLLAEPVPPGLRGRCEAIARTAAPGVARSRWVARPVLVLAAVVLIVFTASALISLATQRSDGVLAAQLAADHAKCFRLFAPHGGTSADASAVERMLAEEYGWTIHVPPSSAADDVQLIGARRCLYGEGLMPHILYRVHGEDVSLFALTGTERKAADVVTLGQRSQIWSKSGTTYVLVSPAEASDLARGVRYVMREVR